MNKLAFKQHFLFSLIIILACTSYHLYLAFNTRMEIAMDAISYENLGQLINTKGFFPSYFQDAPKREPVYPLMVATAIQVSKKTGLAYTLIMAIGGTFILFLIQLFCWQTLARLRINTWIILGALLYIGLSPGIINTAFSLYSEISAFIPLIVIIYLCAYLEKAFLQNRTSAILFISTMLGFAWALATLTKAVFEIVAPFYLIILLSLLCFRHRKINLLGPALLVGLCALLIPMHQYKMLNQQINGQYALTDRGSWALYGSTARRCQSITPSGYLAALSYAAGEGVCAKLFSNDTCTFWSYRISDDLGMTRSSELSKNNVPLQTVNTQLIKESIHLALLHPAQYAILTATEAIKIFFYESTQIGFVQYPKWLEKIYAQSLFKNILRLILGLASLLAFAHWFPKILSPSTPITITCITLVIFLTTIMYSFFFILPRYALPLAPLFVICIATYIDRVYNIRHGHPSTT